MTIDASGARHVVDWPQSDVAEHLGGPVTFVGVIDELDVIAVARRDVGGAADGARFRGVEWFDDAPRGTIVLVSADAAGNEQDVPVEALHRHLDAAAHIEAR